MVNKYVDNFDKKVVKLGVKEKASIAVGIFLVICFYFMFFHVDKTPYGYADIPEKLDKYLQSSKYYGNAYNGDKMLVLYYNPSDKEYSYYKVFKDSLDSARRNKKISDLYEFVPFQIIKNNILFDGKEGEIILKGEKQLKKACRRFCIVNPKKKALYFYFEPKSRDVQYLESNLEKLEFWGVKPD